MKKTITIILAAAMLTMSSAYAVNFEDTKGHWAEQTINELVERGVVNGYTDTEFAPEDEVTRAQYLKMIMEATGVKPTPCRAGECLEATASDWYAPYLQKALDCALIPDSMIAGYKQNVEYVVDDTGKATSSRLVYSGAFNGDLPISREEMAVLTQYFYQYSRTVLTNEDIDTSEVKPFKDEDSISDWAITSVVMAAAEGFIEGSDDNSFNPKDATTRAEAATVIMRVISKQEEKK